MDIAKIRKKAKEQAEAGAAPREEKSSGEEQVREKQAEEKPVKEPEAASAETVQSEEAGDEQYDEHPAGAEVPPKAVVAVQPSAVQPDEEENEDIVELLTFYLSNEEFAFRVSEIEEILRFQRITKVPKVPENILGITSLRGKIIPVSDLRKRLSIKGESKIDESRKKILILKGSKGPFGALIDKVKGVIRISSSEISDPPAHLTETEMMFLEGVVLHNNKFISVIRMEEVVDINLRN